MNLPRGIMAKLQASLFSIKFILASLIKSMGGYIDICFFFLVCFPRTIALLALPVFFLDFFQNRNNFC